jgi:glutamate 5-kinase
MRFRQRLESAQTVIVKVGTKVLLDPDGSIAEDAFSGLAKSIAELQKNGRRVLLVSSGAVGLGAKSLGLSPNLIPVCAAAGQSVLTTLYHRAFAELGIAVAQILVTDEDFKTAEREQRLLKTLEHLGDLGVVPILNENDVVNDMLASLVARAVNADLLIILTDVDGIYDAHPDSSEAALIPEIRGAHVVESAESVSEFGRGGIQAKLKAALHAAHVHRVMAVIANGRTPGVLEKIIEGHQIGTLIAPLEAK